SRAARRARGGGRRRRRALLRAGAGGAAFRGARRLPARRRGRARKRAARRPVMRLVSVVQHTSAEYLGLLEDHLEGRDIRFRYFRPFTGGGQLPPRDTIRDGLILLGGGPWGAAGTRD